MTFGKQCIHMAADDENLEVAQMADELKSKKLPRDLMPVMLTCCMVHGIHT